MQNLFFFFFYLRSFGDGDDVPTKNKNIIISPLQHFMYLPKPSLIAVTTTVIFKQLLGNGRKRTSYTRDL